MVLLVGFLLVGTSTLGSSGYGAPYETCWPMSFVIKPACLIFRSTGALVLGSETQIDWQHIIK